MSEICDRGVRGSLAALLSIGLLVFAPNTANAEGFKYFRGGGHASNFTLACAPWLEVGRAVYVDVRYRPANFWDNGPNSYLSITLPGPDVLTYEISGGEFDDSFQRADSRVSGVNTVNLRPNAAIRFATVRPASVSEDSDFVYVQARIRDFIGIRGCSAQINFAVVQPPD